MSGQNLERWSIDQKRAILAKGHNVLVSAGAGSGKTSVLVERVVTFILDEPAIDIDQLLVVTFTEAAAAEMQERIRVRMERLLHAARQSEDYSLVRRIVSQLSIIDQAQISTLHSFCMDIVKRNFLPLGLEPNFSLMNENQAQELREEIAMEMVEEYLREEDSEKRDRFVRMLAALDANDPQKLLPLVLRIDTFSESQPDPVRWLLQVAEVFTNDAHTPLQKTVFAPVFYDWILRLLDDASYGIMYATDMARSGEGLESYLENLEAMNTLLGDARAKLTDSRDLTSVEGQIRACLSLKTPRAKADAVHKEEVSDARKRALETIKLLDEILGRGEEELVRDLALQSEPVRMLCEFVIQFKERLMDEKRKAGKIQFSDLEHLAREALMDNRTGERERLKSRFKAILVDEYQDTSPIQDAMIRLVIRDEGNLFTVGDVKQSIYRFRMAEPKLFLDEYESLGLTKPGEVIDLSENYRSRKEIVDCVNFIFTQLFSEASTGFSYDERAQMISGASYPPFASEARARNRIEMHLIERSVSEEDDAEELTDADAGDWSSLDLTAIEKEALVVGQRVLELMGNTDDSFHDQIFDKSTGEYRPIEYQDIVILLRSAKGRVRVFLDVLRAMGIPASGNAGAGYFESLEVQWLISLLNAIDNPRRELPFVTFLRSPFVGFTNEQLARIRTAGKGNYYDALLRVVHAKPGLEGVDEEEGTTAAWWRDETLIGEVRSFWYRFDSWRKLARRTSVGAVLNRIFSDTEFVRYVSGMKGGLQRKQNVELFMDMARDYDESSTDGVFGFVSYLERVQKTGGDNQGASPQASDDNTVRIMTIHGSKGLEFPVVFIADLGKQFRGDKGETRFGLHRVLGFGPVFNDAMTNRKWKTVASIAIAELEKCESAAEEARVLYVAMTRARERLILVGSAKNINRAVERAALVAGHDGEQLSKSSFLSAKTYLDWVIPAFLRHSECTKILNPFMKYSVRESSRIGEVLNAEFHIQTVVWNHPDGQILPIAHMAELETEIQPNPHRLLNEKELVTSLRDAVSDSKVKIKIVDTIVEPSAIPSKVSATELRRLWAANQEKSVHKSKGHVASAAKLLASPQFVDSSEVSAMESGSAFHRLMQCIDFSVDPTEAKIKIEIERLCSEGKLTSSEARQIQFEDVIGWLHSPLFSRIRNASVVYREQPFFHRIIISGSRYVIAQGVIDCLAQESNRWLIIDYKTDQISESLVEDKAKEYEAQVGAYLAAVREAVKTDKLEAYLYFVKPRASVRVESMDLGQVFQIQH